MTDLFLCGELPPKNLTPETIIKGSSSAAVIQVKVEVCETQLFERNLFQALIRNHRYSDDLLKKDGPGSLPASQQAGNRVCCPFATHS